MLLEILEAEEQEDNRWVGLAVRLSCPVSSTKISSFCSMKLEIKNYCNFIGGSQGSQGFPGDRGFSGPRGVRGEDGAPGQNGRAGINGPQVRGWL